MSIVFDLGDLRVRSVWQASYALQTEWPSRAHLHFLYEIHFIMKGSVVLVADDEKYTLGAGDVCVVPPNLTHYPIASQDVERYSFFFSLDSVESNENNEKRSAYQRYDRLFSAHTLVVGKQEASMRVYLEAFCRYANGEDFADKQRAKNLLSLLFLETCEKLNKRAPAPVVRANIRGEDTDLEMCIDRYFSDHYTHATLQDFADAVGYCPKQTARILKKITGKTFNEFLTYWRMLNAKMLVVDTERTLNEIAEMGGYDTYNGFFKAFKATFGVSPSELREKEK
jgi:AraC-like DNA-binding protein